MIRIWVYKWFIYRYTKTNYGFSINQAVISGSVDYNNSMFIDRMYAPTATPYSIESYIAIIYEIIYIMLLITKPPIVVRFCWIGACMHAPCVIIQFICPINGNNEMPYFGDSSTHSGNVKCSFRLVLCTNGFAAQNW